MGLREEIGGVIRCSECEYLEKRDAPKRPQNKYVKNFHRKYCYCTCKYAPDSARLFMSDNEDGKTLICVTKKGTDEISIQKSPSWCPKKIMTKPSEVSKDEAYSIVSNLVPKGIFFIKEGDVYTGISNITQDIYVEEFDDKASCFHWLLSQRAHIV